MPIIRPTYNVQRPSYVNECVLQKLESESQLPDIEKDPLLRMVQKAFKASPRVVANNNSSNSGVPRRLRIGANDEGAESGYLHKGRYTYDVHKIFGFFYPLPLVTCRINATSLLLSAFWGPPPPTHCRRHIRMPPKQLERGDAWKKMWFVVKDHVLYTYKAPADARAADSRPLLGYDFDLDVEVRRIADLNYFSVCLGSDSSGDGSVYRVAMVAGDMGWVDLDLGCSTILPSYPADSAKNSSA